MSIPIMDILQLLNESKGISSTEDLQDIRIAQAFNNTTLLQEALFGKVVNIRLADNWDSSNFRRVYIPGALSYLFGYTVEDADKKTVYLSAREWDDGSRHEVIALAFDMMESDKWRDSDLTSFNLYTQQIDVISTFSGLADGNEYANLIGSLITNFNLQAEDGFSNDTKSPYYGSSNTYYAPFIGEIDTDIHGDITEFQVILSPTILNAPGYNYESAVNELYNLVATTDADLRQQIINLVTGTAFTVDPSDLDGKRFYIHHFWNQYNESAIEQSFNVIKSGISELYTLLDTKPDTININGILDGLNIDLNGKVETVLAQAATGITIDLSTPTEPTITANDPQTLSNFYNKSEIDTNHYTKSEIDTNHYTKSEVDSLIQNPTGTVLAFESNTIPTGYLLCDGSAVSRTTYSNLFALIGVTHGVGDGVNTFNIPNKKGVFLRGAGERTGTAQVKANGSNYNGGTLGSYGIDKMFGHYHDIYQSLTNGLYYVTNNTSPGTTGYTLQNASGYLIDARYAKSNGIDGIPNTGDETNPFYSAVNFIIKY